MKTSLLITLLALAALTTACDRKTTTAGSIEKIKADTKQAEKDLKDYDYAQKAEFVAGMQAHLDEINRELDALAAKVAKSNAAAQAEATPKIEALRSQTAKLASQLDLARNADESAWNDIKAGFRSGYNELKSGFNQARDWISEKIAS